MSKKKIMFLLYNMNVGGTEKALINMLEVMGSSIYDVDIYLLKKDGGFLEELPSWVNVKEVDDYKNIAEWVMQPPLLIAKQLIKQRRPIIAFKLLMSHIIFKCTQDRSLYYDVILQSMNKIENVYDCAIAYAGPMDFITKYILNNVKAKEKIQWIHFDVTQFQFNIEFAKSNYSKFDKVVVCAKESANNLINIFPSIKDKILVVPNFVSKKKCLEKSKDFIPYSKDEIDNKKIILTVGRLTEEKGQDIIPSVANNLINSGFNDFVWYIVGDGKNYNMIKNEVERLGLDEYIKMVGSQINPYPYYANCDLYVQTSLHEGYCITIAEALVFGKFVITTDVAGAYDQITRDDKGKILKRDTQTVTEEILNCLRGL